MIGRKSCHACHELVREAQERICALNGLSPLSDDSWFMQKASMPLLDATDLAVLKTRLYDEYRIEVPFILWNGRKFMRVSVQGYNTQQDVEKLVEALEEIKRFGE
jgi:isopenicillin-N epimerase